MPGTLPLQENTQMSSSGSTTPPASPSSRQSSTPTSQLAAPTTRSQTAAAALNGGNSGSAFRLLSQNTVATSNGRTIQESSFLGPQEEGQINIGDEYQADIPDCDPDDCLLQYMQEEATDKRQSICVWKGPDAEDMLTEEQIRDFCIVARERYHFNVEQALGILQYANMDVERAMKSLEDYRSMPDEWSRSDKILFEQAFAFNGKIFRRIKQMLPDKTISDLVEYYYSWKKKRQRQTSFAEQAYRKRKSTWIDDTDEVDLTQREQNDHNSRRPRFDPCINCQIACAQLQQTEKGRLCGTCFLYWRRTGELRPIRDKLSAIADPPVPSNSDKNSDTALNVRPVDAPVEMSLNVIDFVDSVPSSSKSAPTCGDLTAAKRQENLRKLAAKLDELRAKSQQAKTAAESFGFLSSVRQGLHEQLYDISHLRKDTPHMKHRITPKWAAYDSLMALQGFRRYGRDFAAIADVIGNKTEGHVRQFYDTHKDQFKIDELIKNCEQERTSLTTSSSKAPSTTVN